MPGVNLEEYESVRIGGLFQRIFMLPFGADIKAHSSSEYLHEPVITPWLDIIVRAVADHPLYRIAVIF